jgi:uncharacterized protein YggE
MRANFLAHAFILSVLLAVGALLTLNGTAVAADEFDHITVTASGQASIKPDVAEVRAAVSGSAAMAADALKKFHDNRRRAVEAIKKLKLDNLSVEGGGLSMTSAGANANRMVQILGANQNAGTPGHITVTENLVLRLSAIDRMKEGEPAKAVSSMIDAAKDAGLTLGSAGGIQAELVRFRSTKLEDARTAAVQNAMQSARRKADALAALSKAKILRIASSREVTAPPVPASVSNPLSGWMAMMGMADTGASGDADEAASNVLKPIPVNVTIEVQFAASGGH